MAFSPMMRQYLQTKENYPDTILMYRLGDFYEMFFEDAVKASEILNLVLTGRDCGDGKRAPMCGVPFHAVESYINKLLAANQKVAICEQLSEPTKGAGIVERDVVQVITAGTVMNNSLDERTSNYIACVYTDDTVVAISFADLSTGMFVTTQFDYNVAFKQLQELLVAYKPAEIIGNNNSLVFNKLECILAQYVPNISLVESRHFDNKFATNLLRNQLAVATLDGFGLRGKHGCQCSSGALMKYLLDTQKRALPHIKSIKYIDNDKYMSIDIKTRKNLELSVSNNENKKKGSLLWLIDKTVTAMGSRMLSNWVDRPLQSSSAINNRLNAVEELYQSFVVRDKLIQLLHGVKDIERLAGRIAYNSMSPRDCNTLASSLAVVPQIKQLLAKRTSKLIIDVNNNMVDLQQVVQLLNSAIVDDAPMLIKDGGLFRTGYSSQLDQLIELSINGKNLIAKLEEQERQRTGIKTLKLGYNKVFGYYFEVTNSYKQMVPSDYIRKQTTVNSERYVSEDLKVLEEKVLTAEEKRLKLEKQLFDELRTKLLEYIPTMQTTANSIATLDCILSLATVATTNGYIKPTINSKDSTLQIVDGRHPVVESYIKRDNFIANDTTLDTNDNRTMIITGPNMAGKSTYMRQVALIVLMAHIGSFVPASKAIVPIVDKIFTRVGASDDLTFNQSTFMVEMVEVANIVNNATISSLIILDEVGRGTSTFDGLSIAWAIMEYISNNVRAKTLFATHYHELTELEDKVDGVKNYRVTVKEYDNSVIFLHKIARGGANKSFGIEVAKLAGVPDAICSRARQIVALLEDSDISVKIDNITQTKQRIDDNKVANEVVSILKDIDVNKCSPIEAFDILNNLIKKVKK